MAFHCKGSKPFKQRNTAELDAENIDNTAPVKNIIQSLQQNHLVTKPNYPYTYYCATVKQRKTFNKWPSNFHYIVPGHTLYAFDDDWDGQLNKDYFETFPYKSKMPLYITPIRNIDKLDPVTEYIKQKKDWQQACFNLKISCINVKLDIIKSYEHLNEEVVYCPEAVVQLAALLDSDPDPNYTEMNYNVYYGGNGNMQLVCIQWVDYLLHSQFNCLYLSRFDKQNISMQSEFAAIFDCGTDNDILETICSCENDLVALRTRFKVFILKINTSDGKIVFEKLKATESEVPFISVSFDNYHKNILYITTLDNKLTIVNVDMLKGRSVKLNKESNTFVDNWHTVIGTQRSYYTHVSKKSIEIHDKRTNDVAITWSSLRSVTDDITCNDISAAKQIPGSSYLYFCSDHHLFLMDLRSTPNGKPKVVQRWMHGMKCTPTYISLCHFEYNKELICLSSQWCEDMCVVPNYEDKSQNVPGVSVPYRPPSVFNTLYGAREKLLCNDIYNPIELRLSLSITGSLVFGQGEKYVVLMHNALGDISAHTLYPEHMEMFIEDDSIECLDRWSNGYVRERKDLEISHMVDLGKVWEELKKVPDSYTVGEGKSKFRSQSEFDEQEIHDAADNEKIDSALMDIWFENTNDGPEKSFLHYSDSE